jgi:hypothetical protein
MSVPDCISCWDKIAQKKDGLSSDEGVQVCLECKVTPTPIEAIDIPETQEMIY